ncbi:MAG: SH3 domain-containing protein [Gammaproteobacteria bacterium]|nr:SH3 domain-containing protein [Gammaproteobacteria bacterium]
MQLFSFFNKNRFLAIVISGLFLSVYFTKSEAMEVPVYDFPISAYSQNVSDYLLVDGDDISKNLLSSDYQHAQLKQFYNHYYSTDEQGLSPWSKKMVQSVLPWVKKNEPETLDSFNNQDKSDIGRHYAENFKEHDQVWWYKLQENMDFPALNTSEYIAEHRAIAITNTFARTLPEAAPDFYHPSVPGQGFPFDNLQESAIWAGTPLYVVSTSKDKAWSLIFSAGGYASWVKSSDIAYVSSEFIAQWQQAAQHKLVAITKTEASIVDEQQQFQFTGYIGAIFPGAQRHDQQTAILIPIKNSNNQAVIKVGLIDTNASAVMPLAASKKNMATLLRELQNRPYGWGGIFFYNDCSQEMKSIFTPFGIWLPRNSVQQARTRPTLDLSSHTMDERLQMLEEKGHPLMTMIYIDGHVMLYLGYKDIDNHGLVAMTYQNIWGMSSVTRDKRYVIGQSLFFPLLNYYPEAPDARSLADKPLFKLVYLDDSHARPELPRAYARKLMSKKD